MQWLADLFPNVVSNQTQFVESIWQTLYMLFASGVLVGVIGLVLGVALVVTEPGQVLANAAVYQVLDKIVNVMRSIPFIILLALVTPLTKLLVGTSIGTTAAIVPLVIGCTPFYARQVQGALASVDQGLVEAAVAMGLSPVDIIFKVYLKDGAAEIARTSIVTIISLIGLTAMAGAVGAGGLGDIAITLGYNQFENDVTVAATLIILLMVLVIQFFGDLVVKRLTH
ncbi:methionine ABC transporter permease [Limosilactobacillus antri]|uniref:methionine ABC transporter permease n=1 Tax=Limosilactobacillus antri TaxID=227943 RepID=UPI001F5852B0|nr:methionine ABC transporter permease [Limosilactobacillus antri]